MAPTHPHHGADRVLRGVTPRASSDMNVTPLIDAAKGAGVHRVGIVTDGMKAEALAGRGR